MKIRVGDLRTLINEEYLNGVPEWQLRTDTKEFVDRIRDRITTYVLINKSETSLDRQEAINAMNAVCDELEEKVYAVLEGQLYSFTRQV